MLFSSIGKKISFIFGNHMEGCRNDVNRIEKMLNIYNFDEINKFYDCNPLKILKSRKDLPTILSENDLLYIHYSGHGVKRGKMINGKMEILSCWLDETQQNVISSYEVDTFLNSLKCKIILICDCCHSGTFGKYYTKNNLIFIGTSQLSLVSHSYKLGNKLLGGAIIYLFEYLLEINKEISLENIKNSLFFEINKIKIRLEIKN